MYRARGWPWVWVSFFTSPTIHIHTLDRVTHLIWISAFQLGAIASKLPEATCFCPRCDKYFWKCLTFDSGARDLNRDSCFHSKNSYPLNHIPRPILAFWCLLMSNYSCHISESGKFHQSILLVLYWGISAIEKVTTAVELMWPSLLLTNHISRNVHMSVQTYSL